MSWAYWTSGQGGGVPLFFDEFSNGLGGFSFRKLKSDYTGRWGRFLNVNTAEERDIGFDNNMLDLADLADLTNGTDTVRLKNYDNSFSGIYFTPDPDRMPIVANAGTLLTLGGLPCADFPAISRIIMSLSDVSNEDPEPVSIYSLGKIDTYRQRNITVGNVNTTYAYMHGGTLSGYNGVSHLGSSVLSSLSDEDLNRRLATYHWDGTTLKLASNGSSLTSFTGRSGPQAVRNIGCSSIATNQSFSGKIQEILFFSANKEADDAAIRANINSFYSVW